MADIIAWPNIPQSEGAKRIAFDLAQALAGEVDLGPRGPHMKVLSTSIIANIDKLRNLVDQIRSNGSSMDLGFDFYQNIDFLMEVIEIAARSSYAYAEIQIEN